MAVAATLAITAKANSFFLASAVDSKAEMSEIQCSLHYCSLQYRLVKWIFIIDRDMLLWWINRTVSWVLCRILIILIHSDVILITKGRDEKKCNVLSLLSNRCFFLFYLVVQKTMRPKIKAKLFSGTWTCLCFALVDWEKPNKVNKGIIEAFEWYNQDNPKLYIYIYLYKFVWCIFL